MNDKSKVVYDLRSVSPQGESVDGLDAARGLWQGVWIVLGCSFLLFLLWFTKGL